MWKVYLGNISSSMNLVTDSVLDSYEEQEF